MKLEKILLFYSTLLISLSLLGAILGTRSPKDLFLALLFLPVMIYLWAKLIKKEKIRQALNPKGKRAFFPYLFLSYLLTLLTASFLFKLSLKEYWPVFLIPALLIGIVWVLFSLISNLEKRTSSPPVKRTFEKKKPVKTPAAVDFKKRDFLKVLSSLGIGTLVYSLFTKKAHALSFGGTGIPDPIGLKHFSGTGTDLSLTLTSADTAYQCPESGSVPAADYVLNVYNGSDSDVYWGWSSDIAATSAKRRIIPTGGTLSIDLAASDYLYLVCGSAGKVVAYGHKQRS